MVTDQQLVTIPEDGYSLTRETKLHREEKILPAVLQMGGHNAVMEVTLPVDAMAVLDTAVYPGQGMIDRSEQAFIQPGWCQILYTDPEGNLRGEQGRFESSIPMPTDDSVTPTLLWEAEEAQAVPSGGAVAVNCQLTAREMTVNDWAVPALSGITLGEPMIKDPDRPSLLLRRCGTGSLWDIAKNSGTTVSAIKAANNMVDDYAPDKMLIIPIS
jgi:hypothetical protein